MNTDAFIYFGEMSKIDREERVNNTLILVDVDDDRGYSIPSAIPGL